MTAHEKFIAAADAYRTIYTEYQAQFVKAHPKVPGTNATSYNARYEKKLDRLSRQEVKAAQALKSAAFAFAKLKNR